jgi:NADPH:quinone reductase-like Zn-dependent oxidoreductase
MQAWVIREAGGPEQFSLGEWASPAPKPGWVKIRVRAFGLNRSEWFTRRGDSPSVAFPRVLGIECVGEVLDAGGTDIREGDRVAAIMGGMGRSFDGSYAEETLVPRSSVFRLTDTMTWEKVAALPEMLQTTHGSLHVGLEIERAESLLIRGGTSSIGLAALAMAKDAGLHVGTTSRSDSKEEFLRSAGADEVWLDDGHLAQQQAEKGVLYDRVLDLVGATTLLDSLRCVKRGGIVCMTGILGGKWALDDFHPMGDVPTGVKLTSYSGEAADLSQEELSSYVSLVERGRLKVATGPVFDFSQLKQAHALMDANSAGGKIVVRGAP